MVTFEAWHLYYEMTEQITNDLIIPIKTYLQLANTVLFLSWHARNSRLFIIGGKGRAGPREGPGAVVEGNVRELAGGA